MATDLGKVGMVDKGNYNSASTYEAMDVVTDNSTTYIAIQNVPVNTPPTNTSYWREAFSNALIGNSDISNVAASITEAIGNTALPSGFNSLSGGIKFISNRMFLNEYELIANGGTATVDLSILPHVGSYIVMCGGQYNPLWRFAGILCKTESSLYLYPLVSDETLTVSTSNYLLILTNNNDSNNQMVTVSILG